MKPRHFALIGTLLLSGCANDNYAVNPGGPGSQDHLSADLKVCKKQTLDAYIASRNTPQHGLALLVGSAGLGAVGGVAAGEIDKGNGEIPASQINPMIEKCMSGKGYTGTSEN